MTPTAQRTVLKRLRRKATLSMLIAVRVASEADGVGVASFGAGVSPGNGVDSRHLPLVVLQ